MNPADFFIKIMNESGLIIDEMKASSTESFVIDRKEVEAKLQQRINQLVTAYKSSSMIEEYKQDIYTEPVRSENTYQISWFNQFMLIMNRAFKNEMRNPMNFKTTIYQTLFVVFLVDSLYNNVQFLPHTFFIHIK